MVFLLLLYLWHTYKAKKYFHDDLVAAMEENQLQIWKGRIKVLYSSLKDSDAAILGASALAW